MNTKVENWLRSNFKPKMSKENIFHKDVLCLPLIQENSYAVKATNSIKIKVDNIIFRYLASSPMPQTKNYQVLYKILKH